MGRALLRSDASKGRWAYKRVIYGNRTRMHISIQSHGLNDFKKGKAISTVGRKG